MTTPTRQIFGTAAFGFVLTLSSGFGQTFFISLFNADLRQAFSLSHGEIGGLYFFGTLASAIVIVWAGKLLDRIDLRLYTLAVTTGLACACVALSLTQGPLSLAVAFFLLRFFGQGLSGHTGITTASRVNADYRGRTVSIAGLGFSCAEALLPVAVVAVLAGYHWRSVWLVSAVFELLVIGLLAQWLLTKYSLHSQHTDSNDMADDRRSWSRRQVQHSLADYKAFSFQIWATAIAAYSVAAVVSSIIAGIAVDRWSGATVLRLYLLPFVLAVLITAFTAPAMLPFIHYALIGMTAGIATPAVSALWLELYGPAHIAAIRSLTHAFMVFGSAIGPVIVGTLLDQSISWPTILTASALWMIAITLPLCVTDLGWRNSTHPPQA